MDFLKYYKKKSNCSISLFVFLIAFSSGIFQNPISLNAQIVLKSPGVNEVVEIHGKEMFEYLNLPKADRRVIFNNQERRSLIFKEREPVPTRFVWFYSDDIEGPFRIEISRDSYFTQPASFLLISQSDSNNYGEILATNFLLGSKYYWRITGKKGNRKVISMSSEFSIAENAPRLIMLPNVPNVRDLGGWSGLNGRKVKQGMIFRSEGLNDNSPDKNLKDKDPKTFRLGKNRLTGKSKDYIKDYLGWKVELDLRRDDEVGSMNESPVGPSVKWIHNTSQSYQRIFNPVGRDAMAKNFRLFTNLKNYPIDIHCISGADRTGSLAFMLNGVLGVSLNDLAKDWEISAYKTFVFEERWDQLINGLSQYGTDDTPLYIKIERYLKDIGITQDEIEKFRSIMLGD